MNVHNNIEINNLASHACNKFKKRRNEQILQKKKKTKIYISHLKSDVKVFKVN